MQFKKGVSVLGDQGKKVGEVQRVVIDPQTGEVTHLVISGGLFSSEKVVPLEWILRTDDDQVRLNVPADSVKDLPDYMEVNFVRLDRSELARHNYPEEAVDPIYWYPMTGAAAMFTANGMPSMVMPPVTPPYRVDEKENIPKGSIALKEGARVIDNDGKHVGDVEKVLVEDERERVTHLLVTKGTLTHHKRLIPANWIREIKDDGVKLAVSADFVENLKEYKE